MLRFLSSLFYQQLLPSSSYLNSNCNIPTCAVKRKHVLNFLSRIINKFKYKLDYVLLDCDYYVTSYVSTKLHGDPANFMFSTVLNLNSRFIFHISANMYLFVVSFLLGKSPASVYYCMPTFRNSLSVPSSKAMVEH